MDSACVYEQKAVLHELTQGIQMAKQLRSNLNSVEAREFLIPKILSSYENALHVLKSGNSAGQPQSAAQPVPNVLESSISLESQGSEGFEFDQPFFGQQGQNVISKKRKGSTMWEDQVRMCTDNGLEGNTDDGYNWRKYGQKYILGAKFPRSYYRCTYRKAQNCLATKQVQRTDKDSTVYEIAYKGRHTCKHGTQSAVPQPSSPEKYEIKLTHHQLSPPNPSEMLSNLRANLSVDTSGFSDATIPSPISLPSTSLGYMEDSQQFHFPANYFDEELLQVYSPPFISPATSATNYFPEWTPSLDFLDTPAVLDPDFKFDNPLF